MRSLQHDHAFALAKTTLDIFLPCLREEEQREAFNLVYEAAKAALEHYELMADRRQRRIGPSNN